MKQIFLLLFFLLFSILLSAQEFTIDKIHEFNIGQSYIAELTMEIEDNFLYLMSTYGLEIFEILSDGTLELKSRLGLTYTSRFRKAGDYVYIVTSKSGEFDPFPYKLYQINVSDVENPYIVSEMDSDYRYTHTEEYGDYLHVKQVINSQNIDSFYSLPDLTLVAQYLNYFSFDFLNNLKKINNNIALRIDDMNVFTIFDISDPASPQIIGNADLTAYHQYRLDQATLYQENILMCTDSYLITFWDVSDWNDWQFISQYQFPYVLFNHVRPLVKDSMLILAGFGCIELLDVSDITQPQQIDILNGTAIYFYTATPVLYQDRIYLSANWNGIQSFEIVDNEILFIEEIAENYETADCVRYGDYLITKSMLHEFKYYDISDPTNPVDMGNFLPAHNYYFKFSNCLIAAVDSDSHDCFIYDITDIQNPILQNRIELDYFFPEFDQQDENSIYFLNQYDNSIRKYDISTTGIYQLLFQEQLPYNIRCFSIQDGYGYIVGEVNSIQNLYIYEGLDDNIPVLCNTQYDAFSFTDPRIKFIDDMMSVYTISASGTSLSNHTKIYDLSDPVQPVFLYQLSTYNEPIFHEDLIFTRSGVSCYVFESGNNSVGTIDPINVFYDINSINNIIFMEDNNEYLFLLSQWSNISIFSYNYTPASAGNEITASVFSLSNHPNPFNPSTEIRFQMSEVGESESAEIVIYNIKGQKVKTLPVTPSPGLTVSLTWDGTDRNNQPVSTGVYFYQLQVDGNPLASRKMMILK